MNAARRHIGPRFPKPVLARFLRNQYFDFGTNNGVIPTVISRFVSCCQADSCGVVCNKNLKKTLGTLTDTTGSSIIATYQQRIAAKPYVPGTTYGRPTFSANGVLNKLFLVFLFSERDVSVQFLKAVRLIPSSMLCCGCGSKMS
jgi:hypothetical protein